MNNKTHIIIKVVDDANNDSLIDAYVTDGEHLGKDIYSLMKNYPLTYGIPKYIKIIALHDKENIPFKDKELSQEDADVIKNGIEKLKEECDGKGVVWADDFVKRTLDDLANVKKEVESKKNTLNHIVSSLQYLNVSLNNKVINDILSDYEKGLI